jgi:3-oxoacyl-[acyl-carrier-protein] synthase-3
MRGRLVFKHAIEKFPSVIMEALSQNGMTVEDIDLFLFHQANLRIIELVTMQMNISPEKVYNNIQEYGNTTAASIPIALHEALQKGLLREGQHVLMSSFGSGFTWASTVIRW